MKNCNLNTVQEDYHLVQERCSIMPSPRPRMSISFSSMLCIYTLLLPVLCAMVLGLTSDMDLSENISLAQCRAACLRMFTSGSSAKEERCHKNSDCYMCWNSCRLFQGNSPAKSTLCSDPTACFPGCQTACKFYDVSSPKNLTPASIDPLTPLPAYMATPKLTEEGQLVWTPPMWPKGGARPPPTEVMMYIVMVNVGGSWNQHIQTSSPRAIIPDTIRGAPIRVLAIASTGLVAAAERPSRSPEDGTTEDVMLDDEARVPEREVRVVVDTTTLSIQKTFDDQIEAHGVRSPPSRGEKYSYDYDTDHHDRQPPSVTVDHSWELSLKLLSIDLLASIEVSWDVRGSDQVDYLVTWTESAGGISGHLVTKQAKAEISLWSGQQYSIQVELLDPYGNAVLKSVPKAISFLPDGSSEVPLKVFEPETTSRSTPRRVTTQAIVTRSSTPLDLYPLRGIEEDPHYGGTDSFPSIVRRKGFPLWSGESSQDHGSFKPEKGRPFPPKPPLWEIDHAPSPEPPASSGKVETFNTAQEEESSSPLMVWAACLGVGAVVILILIALAARTLRHGASKRRQMRRGNADFLSETTASSVNSSNVTTCSQLSRGPHRSHEEDGPWAYETLYGVANRLPTRTGPIQRPPPPIHSPPNPANPMLRQAPPLRQVGAIHFPVHGHPSLPTAHFPTQGVGSTSFIENYIMTLDPSPVEQRTDH